MQPPDDPITRFLASWGALLSTALAVWNIRKDIKDRGSLRVLIYFRDTNLTALIPNSDRLIHASIRLEITNTGKRATYVISVGFQKRKCLTALFLKLPPVFQPSYLSGKNGPFSVEYTPTGVLPRKLEPSEPMTIDFEDANMLQMYKVQTFVRDTLGNKFFANRKLCYQAAHRYRFIVAYLEKKQRKE